MNRTWFFYDCSLHLRRVDCSTLNSMHTFFMAGILPFFVVTQPMSLGVANELVKMKRNKITEK